MATALMKALDTHTPVQLGENGHAEYGWSNDTREKIVQLSFQVVRTSEEGARELGEQLYNIANSLKNILDTASSSGASSPDIHRQEEESSELLDMLRRMVVQTRDIEAGKGEYSIGREFIRQWYRIYPCEALQMIKYYVKPIPQVTEEGVKYAHPYGSWKDIKFLWRTFGGERCDPVVLNFMIRLVNDQLKEDLSSENPSLVARWVARESASKKNAVPFKAFYHALAEDYFAHYLATARTPESKVKAQRKAYQHYRQQVLSPLNAKLKTPQIKQCAGEWSAIDYKHDVTSITMRKQTRAFMYQNKDGTSRGDDPDRVQAAENFDAFVNTAVEKGETIKGKRVGFNTIAHDAWALEGRRYSQHESVSSTEINVQDLQWESMLETLGELGDMVPMIDLSGSMSGDPMDAAMGLGLAVASKSCLGKRAMTFSTNPHWMNFDGCNKLSEMISKMYEFRNDWGGSTNFTAALTLILDMCVKLKLPAADVANIKLLILSDMQIDSYGNEKVTDTMWHNITQRYAEAGMKAIGEPYKPGHIIFWNLRHTGGFPTLSSTPNITMFSGFSPVLLNEFAQKGMDALQDTTPFNQLKDQLANPRYNILDFA
jgi:hypothetical protein